MSPLRTASAIRRGVAGLWSSTPSTARAPPARAHGPGQAAAARVEALVADLLVDAQRPVRPGGGQPPAGLEPGALLGLADVGEDAEPAVDVAAGVDRDHRDARPAPRGGWRAPGRARGSRRRARRAAWRRLVDHGLHALHAVHVGRAVADDHVHLAGRGLDAVAHDGPERARRLPVRDHGDAHAAAGARRRLRGPLGRLAGGDDERRLVHDGGPAAAGAAAPRGGRAPRASCRLRQGDPRLQARAGARRAVDREDAVDDRQAILQPAQPAARVEVGAAHAVVGDEHDDARRRRGAAARAPPAPARSARRWSAPRPRRSRRPPRPAGRGGRRSRDSTRTGTGARSASAAMAGSRPLRGEDRRMDAARELAQLAERARPGARRARRRAARPPDR